MVARILYEAFVALEGFSAASWRVSSPALQGGTLEEWVAAIPLLPGERIVSSRARPMDEAEERSWQLYWPRGKAQ